MVRESYKCVLKQKKSTFTRLHQAIITPNPLQWAVVSVLKQSIDVVFLLNDFLGALNETSEFRLGNKQCLA